MRNVKKPSQFRLVATALHELGPKIVEANGGDIKFGCKNKDFQKLFERGDGKKIKSEDAYVYSMWEKIIAQAKLLTEYGGGHIPVTMLETDKKGGWR